MDDSKPKRARSSAESWARATFPEDPDLAESALQMIPLVVRCAIVPSLTAVKRRGEIDAMIARREEEIAKLQAERVECDAAATKLADAESAVGRLVNAAKA